MLLERGFRLTDCHIQLLLSGDLEWHQHTSLLYG